MSANWKASSFSASARALEAPILEHVTDMDEAGDREIDAASLDDEFSVNDCDSCRSSLAGARHPAHGYVTLSDGRREFVHMSVCVDCAMYHANGELPFDDDTVE